MLFMYEFSKYIQNSSNSAFFIIRIFVKMSQHIMILAKRKQK